MKAKKNKKHIAVYYPNFLGGGAEAVGLWILETLKENYELTLVTNTWIDFDRINMMYGTHLTEEVVHLDHLIPKFATRIFLNLVVNNANLNELSCYLLLRFLKRKANRYDLVISGRNAVDLGVVGIQYIHWVADNPVNRLGYLIAKFSEQRLKQNISLANSKSIAERIRLIYGIESKVVYPPVTLAVSPKPWHAKEDAFICSGRLVRAKQPHRIIETLRRVRDRGFDIKLCITSGGVDTYAKSYQDFLHGMIMENQSWISLYENLSYQGYIDLLAQCKYGIHFKPEPFGISVAEMLKSGAITFVYASRNKKVVRGQLEITGNREELIFYDEDDAANKIVNVLANESKQNELVQYLEARKTLFSAERFALEINQVVDEYFSKGQT